MNQAPALTLGKILTCAVLLPLTVVAAACQGPPPSGSTVGAMATPTPGAPTQTSAFTPVPTVEYVLSDLPRCPGMEQQSAFQFEWPDLENALEKLADYTWGYYRCALTPPDLVQFYRDQMLQPPYLWREVNHAEHHSGLVVLFYHPVKITWAYLWLLPGPDAQSSYLVISRSDPGEPQAWECRLLASPASASQGG